MDDCRKKIALTQLEDKVRAFTFHGAALDFFLDRKVQKDFGDALIYDAVRSDTVKEGADLASYGIIFVDEAQDLTDHLAEFTVHFVTHINRARALQGRGKVVMCIVGDPFPADLQVQEHHELQYMMHPDRYFGDLVAGGTFRTLPLNICFRISHKMAGWVNEHFNPILLKPFFSAEMWHELGRHLILWWGTGIQADPSRARR